MSMYILWRAKRHQPALANPACRRLLRRSATLFLRQRESGCASCRCRKRNWFRAAGAQVSAQRTGANLGHSFLDYSMRKLLALFFLFVGSMATAQEITVAAAADMSAALPELVSAYTKKTGQAVKLSFGASGNNIGKEAW